MSGQCPIGCEDVDDKFFERLRNQNYHHQNVEWRLSGERDSLKHDVRIWKYISWVLVGFILFQALAFSAWRDAFLGG